MPTRRLILTLSLLAPTAFLRAGEDLQLDKDFSFRLTPPELKQPPVAPLPATPFKPEIRRATPLTTPEGAPLPPGSRPWQFNGQTYYFIPL